MANWPDLEYLNVGDCLLRSDGATAIANTIEKCNTNLQVVIMFTNISTLYRLVNLLKYMYADFTTLRKICHGFLYCY